MVVVPAATPVTVICCGVFQLLVVKVSAPDTLALAVSLEVGSNDDVAARIAGELHVVLDRAARQHGDFIRRDYHRIAGVGDAEVRKSNIQFSVVGLRLVRAACRLVQEADGIKVAFLPRRCKFIGDIIVVEEMQGEGLLGVPVARIAAGEGQRGLQSGGVRVGIHGDKLRGGAVDEVGKELSPSSFNSFNNLGCDGCIHHRIEFQFHAESDFTTLLAWVVGHCTPTVKSSEKSAIRPGSRT